MTRQLKLRGFTLMELLVVIAIIGLLASVVLVSIDIPRAKGRDAQRISDLQRMKVALLLYHDANGSFPDTSSRWLGEFNTCNASWYNQATDWVPGLVSGGFIQNLPQDPAPNGCNLYIYRSNGTDFMLLAHRTVETFDPDGPPQHPMDRQNFDQQSVGVWSQGAINW